MTRLLDKLLAEEIKLLIDCREAGEIGAVIPSDLKTAMTLAGMKLIEEVAPNAFTITPAGRAAINTKGEENEHR